MNLDTEDSGPLLAHGCRGAVRVCLRLCLPPSLPLSLWGRHSRQLWGRCVHHYCYTPHTAAPQSFAQALSYTGGWPDQDSDPPRGK